MEFDRDTAGLFVDPSITGLLKAKAIGYAPADEAAIGISAVELQLLTNLAQPALRGLRLAGYQPLAMDVIDDHDTSRPAPAIARITFDETLSVETASPDLSWQNQPGVPLVQFSVMIYAKPFKSPGGTSYALQFDAQGTSWIQAPGRPEDGADSIALCLYVVAATTIGTAGPATPFSTGPVDSFRFYMQGFLAGQWSTVPQTDESQTLRAPAKGLMWLFEPRHWFPASVYANTHAASMKTIARLAQVPSYAAAGDVALYFQNQMTGDWQTRETLKNVTGQTLRAFFRAGEFPRSLQRWSDSGTAPFAPIERVKPISRQLPWFDLICFLVEAKILLPVGLDQGEAFFDGFDDPLEFEELIAIRDENNAYAMDLCLHGGPSAPEDNPYSVVAHITGEHLMQQDAELLYDPAFPQSPPLQPFENMFTWEYVPPETEGGQPKLLIVAGPGVSVGLVNGAPIQVEVMRKIDFGIPAWGERIDVQRLYKPVFLPNLHHIATGNLSNAQGCMIIEKADGIEYHYYESLVLDPDTKAPTALPSGGPDAKVEITTLNKTAAGAAFRSDFDFVQRNIKGAPLARPLVRIWRSGDEVVIKTTESYGQSITLQVYDQPDLHKMYDHYPHMLPVSDMVQQQGAYVITGQQAGQTVAYGGSNADFLPYISAADITSAGMTAVDVTAAAGKVQYDYAMGWMDLLYMGADIFIGLHPYSIALDVAEFFYAYNTGRDRYGRPITTLDLYLMAAGIALPVSGFMLTQIRRGAPALRLPWQPPPGAAASEATALLDDAVRQMDNTDAAANAARTTLQSDVTTLVGRYSDDLADALDEAGAAAAKAYRSLANLFDDGATAFASMELQYHYRRWISSKVLAAGTSLNPRGFT